MSIKRLAIWKKPSCVLSGNFLVDAGAGRIRRKCIGTWRKKRHPRVASSMRAGTAQGQPECMLRQIPACRAEPVPASYVPARPTRWSTWAGPCPALARGLCSRPRSRRQRGALYGSGRTCRVRCFAWLFLSKQERIERAAHWSSKICYHHKAERDSELYPECRSV